MYVRGMKRSEFRPATKRREGSCNFKATHASSAVPVKGNAWKRLQDSKVKVMKRQPYEIGSG